MKMTSRHILPFVMATFAATNALGKDQARDGARKINDEYQFYINTLSVSDDPDELLAKELCGFQIFTEWGGHYMSIIKSTPNLEISDVQPVSDLVIRLQKIEEGFEEAQRIFPEHYRTFRTAMTTLRSQGVLVAEASRQGISLAAPKELILRDAFLQCSDPAFVTNSVYRMDASFWSGSITYSFTRPGTIGVSWGVTGSGTPYYTVSPGEIVVSTSKRSSFLRKALTL